ncbi:dienelactone hydrolase family protein [Rhodococcus sp. T7]|uniref:dienelactone hydrolase family protein n=1 Tax=Rhodococcus sp. T7 TaxID=627444 RepID=UPI001356E5E8|nr:alpha/beta fold hydrolase [Rhodococcus sp. T7]KAF0957360.1 putative phosphoribosyl transferase [Rhodococcus sp. T7]KAF0966720.1 putative phosphoribosyl transferase [Rhodococcus sp. T7]
MVADGYAAGAVTLPVAEGLVNGDLDAPPRSRFVVVFAHGAGSSRRSPRNRRVAAALQRAGYATLLMDLLTADEELVDVETREYRFDIPRLAERLIGALDWLESHDPTAPMPVVTFGASTGAAAALIAAAERPQRVRAVISRGGRPDLAGAALARVTAPTLLIVGALDTTVIELNHQAAEQMTAAQKVEVALVPGATHLFEEPGTLDAVIELTIDALDRHLIGHTKN